MATLSSLILYPVKSCGGLSLQQATLTVQGLQHAGIGDREWAVVDPSGVCLTQREYPRMALIRPQLAGDQLVLSAPDMPALQLALARSAGDATLTVQVWEDQVLASDSGQQAADWFSAVLGVSCRLARFHPQAERAVSQTWSGGIAATTLFSDGYPLLLISQASLDELNQRLLRAGRAALPMNRFRPNVVVDGIEAFDEDYTETFALGEAVLKPVKPCPRCPMPSVDQDSGVVGPDPLDIMQSFRAKPELEGALCFGMNCLVLAGAGQVLRVGQEVEATLAF
ncbi:MOSC domain-containing protein [Pseudoduganella sp. FT93W]|uniref:MOSC domain-containing protein n=1 Tax=Duganella fentianensis TaxID=2692177 RepID=A0A845I001_9BURK|nr:MOSC N-terminal beta barrel domain-containing protein [Duganella fentianensis]MYN46603.1 MOSC domain-containing protein [Duganella fentianensis]